MPAKSFPFKEVIYEKGICPIHGKEYDKIAIAEIDGREYIYIIHKDERGRDKPHYLGPLKTDKEAVKKKIANTLAVYKWLAERGYADKDDYKEVVVSVLQELIGMSSLAEELKKLGLC